MKQQQGKPQAQGREDKAIKPPIGILTQWRHRELRIDEINEAVERYNEMNYNFPIEWIIERREHLSWLHQHLPTSPYLIGWNPDSFIKAAPASSIPTEVQKEEWISIGEYEKLAIKKLADKPVIQMLLNDKKCGSFKDWPSNIHRMIDEAMGATREVRVKLPSSAPPISHKEDEKVK